MRHFLFRKLMSLLERNHFYQIVVARIYEEGEDRSEGIDK